MEAYEPNDHTWLQFVDMTFLNKFNHPNLVKILGYCLEDEQLFLIYEFMENGSLYSHLITKDKMPLPWNTRVKIAVGIAEALLVLERTQKPVDIYPIMLHNILLDKNFDPKISNYECEELANKVPIKAEMCDPLYYHAHAYIFGIKDVSYAFGEVLVRILTGEWDNKIGIGNLNENMKNLTGKPLKERVRRILDPRLPNVDDTTIENAIKLVGVALSCLDNDPCYTVKSALDVLRKL